MIGAERELIAALRYCAESKIGRFYGFAQNEYEMAKKRTSAKEEMRREKEAEKRQEAIAEAQLIVKGEPSPIIPNDDEHCQYCGKKFDKHNVGSFDSFKGVDYLVKAKQCSYCEKITLFEYALTYLRHL